MIFLFLASGFNVHFFFFSSFSLCTRQIAPCIVFFSVLGLAHTLFRQGIKEKKQSPRKQKERRYQIQKPNPDCTIQCIFPSLTLLCAFLHPSLPLVSATSSSSPKRIIIIIPRALRRTTLLLPLWTLRRRPRRRRKLLTRTPRPPVLHRIHLGPSLGRHIRRRPRRIRIIHRRWRHAAHPVMVSRTVRIPVRRSVVRRVRRPCRAVAGVDLGQDGGLDHPAVVPAREETFADAVGGVVVAADEVGDEEADDGKDDGPARYVAVLYSVGRTTVV